MKVDFYKLAIVIVAGSAATLVGCSTESASSGGSYTGNVPHARPGADYAARARVAEAAPAPAPAPAPAAQPAPAPRAASTGNVLYLPTGDRNSSALMIEKIYPAQVSTGQPFDYIIKATNISSLDLNNVVVTEAVPANFTVISSSIQGANGSYNLGTLKPGESKSIVIKGSAQAVGSINACASATYSTALCSTINVVQPALAISKTITPESILNCTPINMTIEVRNTGTGTASNVRVSDTLPAGLTLASGGNTLDEAIGDLAPNQSKTITKELKAASIGSFDNIASAKADGVNPVNSNKVTTVVKQPKLEITCKAGGSVMMGRNACYELTVRNTGNAVAAGTRINVNVPAGAAIASMSDGGANGVFNIGDLAAGASKTVTICLNSNAVGAINLAASATGNCAAPVNTNCSISIIGVPDIGTLVTDDTGVVVLGKDHTYRVEVANQGQIPLTNTRMVLTLPEGMTFLSSPTAKLEGGKVVFNFGTVAPGARPTGTFVVRATRAGELLVVGDRKSVV